LLTLFSSINSYSQSHTLSGNYWNKAQELRKTRQYLKAAQMYVKASETAKEGSNLALAFNEAGYCYYLAGQYDQAITYYKEALAIDKRLGRERGVAAILNNMGLVYSAWGQYDQAITYYLKPAFKII